jgi:hypothetical protein
MPSGLSWCQPVRFFLYCAVCSHSYCDMHASLFYLSLLCCQAKHVFTKPQRWWQFPCPRATPDLCDVFRWSSIPPCFKASPPQLCATISQEQGLLRTHVILYRKRVIQAQGEAPLLPVKGLHAPVTEGREGMHGAASSPPTALEVGALQAPAEIKRLQLQCPCPRHDRGHAACQRVGVGPHCSAVWHIRSVPPALCSVPATWPPSC